jgi:NAD(P)-dependent dehydrogenase (short-subunit alcohol dehydrogenase family)
MDRIRVTIVTGAGRGIGAATAVRLAADGHHVAINFRSDHARAEQTADLVRAAGAQAIVVPGDVSDEADVARLFDRANAELGPVTGLVNNAGVTGRLTSLLDAPTDTIRRVMEVNVVGPLLCARRFARDFAARAADDRGTGAIVNVSSGAATTGSPGEYVHYAASKGAVDTMTVGLAAELGPLGIRVNAVSPGRTRTEMHAAMGDPDRAAKIAGIAPLRRPGEPHEVAAAIAWLLSDDASYTTGANIRVAGGL